MRHPWMHPNGDKVVCNAVEDLDLHESSLRVCGGDGRRVDVGNGARAGPGRRVKRR
jgi:hypothetical protein